MRRRAPCKNETFVEAAIALGASPLRVMALHILPKISSSIIVRTTIGMGGTILTAATLGFLGLGAAAADAGMGPHDRGERANSCPRPGGTRPLPGLRSSSL